MKKLFITLTACAAVAMSLGAKEQADTAKVDTVAGFVFTDTYTVKCTPVGDQNKTGTCWCFSGTAFLQDEVLRKTGKTVDLSEMFTVRHCYEDKANKYVRMYGSTHFAPGGAITDVPYVFARYGAMPEEAYTGLQYGEDKHSHGELNSGLKAYLQAVVKKENGTQLSTAWQQALNGILDAYLGPIPTTFTYQGKTYTPQGYAASLGLNMDDYVPLTSFSHHPFYEMSPLEVPDNWTWASYMNVPLDEMKIITENALRNGYPVLWAADISEPGFHWYDGYANMPVAVDVESMDGTELARWVHLSDRDRAAERYKKQGPVKEIDVTQESRQAMYDRQETTDDHGMEIVGMAVDQEGNPYFKVKNSWDTNQVYDGYFYVSEPFFLAKTLGIMVHKDAIPKNIAKKFKK